MASWLLQVGQLPPFQPRSNTTSASTTNTTNNNDDVAGDSQTQTFGRGLSCNEETGSDVAAAAREESKEDVSEIPEGAEELLLQDDDIAKLTEAWEIISENSSGNTTIICISKPGSVMSLPSSSAKLSAALASGISGGRQLSIPSPFTLQRSLSNSTIASEEAGGMSGCHHSDVVYGIPGVDYVEHVVMPTDTLQGICLSYKTSATRLRQANQFSGNTLLLAPKKLIVPLSKNGLKNGAIRLQDRTTKEFKSQALMAEFTDLGSDDAKKYLATSQWDLDGALRAVSEDGEWEKASVRQRNREGSSHLSTPERKAGDIHITLKVHKGSPIAATIRGSGQRSRLSTGRVGDGGGGGDRSG
mmetsp:Transcript_18319/g.52434  ORF Transcript_18319/g.52434 Transcript_18319/m.52434 type:complete len:358 (-) Transcript_18319:300-1373(-)|eukprot:CAMPEP_0181029726 /NCGR_PEP_ID=MMETSP1070-20121207/5353_1 /TAXON_ID=265543 /ORGANISM="Minutocellus polymorphus, Strain NH13" /LENGTH=357 /DNA_ID=CAMNT_0023107057 /DNA_START=100 /DNA_END=1173 /DNA_ORIENTATION=+